MYTCIWDIHGRSHMHEVLSSGKYFTLRRWEWWDTIPQTSISMHHRFFENIAKEFWQSKDKRKQRLSGYNIEMSSVDAVPALADVSVMFSFPSPSFESTFRVSRVSFRHESGMNYYRFRYKMSLIIYQTLGFLLSPWVNALPTSSTLSPPISPGSNSDFRWVVSTSTWFKDFAHSNLISFEALAAEIIKFLRKPRTIVRISLSSRNTLKHQTKLVLAENLLVSTIKAVVECVRGSASRKFSWNHLYECRSLKVE